MLEYHEKFRISRKISREVHPGIGNTGVISVCNLLPLYDLPCERFHRETFLKIRKIIIRVPPWQKHWPKLSALYRCLSSIWLQITVKWYTRSLPVSFTALSTVSFYSVLCSFLLSITTRRWHVLALNTVVCKFLYTYPKRQTALKYKRATSIRRAEFYKRDLNCR